MLPGGCDITSLVASGGMPIVTHSALQPSLFLLCSFVFVMSTEAIPPIEITDFDNKQQNGCEEHHQEDCHEEGLEECHDECLEDIDEECDDELESPRKPCKPCEPCEPCEPDQPEATSLLTGLFALSLQVTK